MEFKLNVLAWVKVGISINVLDGKSYLAEFTLKVLLKVFPWVRVRININVFDTMSYVVSFTLKHFAWEGGPALMLW